MNELTYHTFNPSTDTLEVGTKIRLAGREGEIVEDVSILYTNDTWRVGFEGFESVELVSLTHYPLLEIADKPVKPLTIDKRVKGEILHIAYDDMSDSARCLLNIEAYLNSLEET